MTGNSDDSDIAYLSATELAVAYRARRLSPVAVAEALLARLDALQPRFNAFCLVDREGAIAAARASAARWQKGEPLGPLDGVPATIKDLVLMRGFATRRGSKLIDPVPDSEDGPAVARLKEAGAVILGKTTTPEFGWKAIGDSPLTGITRNPWNRERTTGGSSAGAAAACAAGIAPLHVGSDGAGSIRIPSAFTGIFGIKATFGRVPAHPASPMGLLSNVGPMAREVRDAAAMLTVLPAPTTATPTAFPSTEAIFSPASMTACGACTSPTAPISAMPRSTRKLPLPAPLRPGNSRRWAPRSTRSARSSSRRGMRY